jgi:DHA1 family bicyclomycin/chloramphenicol resistance-like MFS transporter
MSENTAATSAAAPAPAFVVARPPLGEVVLLGALTAFAPMAIDMYLPGLPSLAAGLHVAPNAAQATVAAFLAGLALGQLYYGPASDRLGRRGPLIAGGVLFTVASVVCALAPNLTVLIIARFVQAVGGSAGTVIARAVVRDRYDHRNAARVLSLLMLVMGLAPIIAPLAGGTLVAHFGWRAIFWILTGFGVIMTLATIFKLEESRSAETAAHALGEHPLRAYLALVRMPALVGYMLASGLNAAALFAYISAAPGLVITTYGFPPERFGLVFGANAIALVGMTQVNARLLRHHTPERILAMARLVSLVFAAVLLVDAFTGAFGMFGVLVPLFFVLGSFGFIGANTAAAALNVDPKRAGSISSLMGVTTFGLGALVSALISAFHDVGPRPMAVTVFLAIAGSSVALYTLAQPRNRTRPM